MVTTIQVSEKLKKELSDLKDQDTYEDVIQKLLKEHKKMIIADQMVEYGKKHGKESLEELKEWEHTDLEW